ncbi:MAG: double zinc ribbon domain-containing protein [[Eubacterium] siraeum]
MKMMMNKYELKRILLDWFFPNRCPLCSKVIGRMDYICDKCACNSSITRRGKPLRRRLLSVCRYNKRLRL